jgi:hypothetical protein
MVLSIHDCFATDWPWGCATQDDLECERGESYQGSNCHLLTYDLDFLQFPLLCLHFLVSTRMVLIVRKVRALELGSTTWTVRTWGQCI